MSANVKNNPANIIAEFVRRRDLPDNMEEGKKTPWDYLVGNLSKECRCGEILENDGSTGGVIADFEVLLKVHGGAIETAFVQW